MSETNHNWKMEPKRSHLKYVKETTLNESHDDLLNSDEEDEESLSSSESSNTDSPRTDPKSFRIDLDDVPLTEGMTSLHFILERRLKIDSLVDMLTTPTEAPREVNTTPMKHNLSNRIENLCSHLFPSARPNIDLLRDRIETVKDDSKFHVSNIKTLHENLKTQNVHYDDLKRVYQRLKLSIDEVTSEDFDSDTIFSWSHIRHEFLDTHKDLLRE